MRILITGASGFVAHHLIKELEPTRHTVILTSRHLFKIKFRSKTLVSLPCDLTDLKKTKWIMELAKPDAVVHLAALPHVGKSWKNPSALTKANVTATKNICESLKDNPVHFLFVSSAMVYGRSAMKTARLNESSRVHPVSPYGKSKLAAEKVVRSYEKRGFHATIVRPFNHTGPGQTLDYVCPAFAMRIRKTKSGGVVPVGDLSAQRDFSDVRDIARAYRLILEKKPKQKLFVLGSGQPVSIENILEMLIRLSGKKIKAQPKSDLFQRGDLKTLVANPALAKRALGWRPRISLVKTLKDLYHTSASAK